MKLAKRLLACSFAAALAACMAVPAAANQVATSPSHAAVLMVASPAADTLALHAVENFDVVLIAERQATAVAPLGGNAAVTAVELRTRQRAPSVINSQPLPVFRS